MVFTFENFPDEILMMIFQYTGDVYTILQTFLGLNQRLNNILLDKGLHLLTNFLHINVHNDYYNSDIFQQVSEQLLSINTTIDEETFCRLLQPVLTFHIKQKYIQLGHEFQSSLLKFKSIRQQLTNDEILKVDDELKTQFDSLCGISITMKTIKHIKSLVLIKGARLECDDYELCRFNFAKAINEQILSHINSTKAESSRSINSIIQLFKTLLISNTSLLKNRDYVGNGGCRVEYFLTFTLYRLRYFYNINSSRPINMDYYRAITDLFLFVIQCHKQMSDNDHYVFDLLEMISKIHNNLFIRTVQLEILKIVVDEYAIKANQQWDEYLLDRFQQILKKLIKEHRLDVIKYIQDHIQLKQFIIQPNHTRECLNIITRNQLERRYFCKIANDNLLDLVFSQQHLIFILLDKKERKLLEKMLKLSPYLIHQLDEDGNDPLLYITLKVYGCRHRIIEMLIKMGSDLQGRNLNGQNFMEILQLPRNKKLFQNLIEHEIIKIDV